MAASASTASIPTIYWEKPVPKICTVPAFGGERTPTEQSRNPDGTKPADVVNPVEDFDALRVEGIHPWVGASIRKIEDMVRADEYGAELITSNEPEYMIEELAKAGLRVKE